MSRDTYYAFSIAIQEVALSMANMVIPFQRAHALMQLEAPHLNTHNVDIDIV